MGVFKSTKDSYLAPVSYLVGNYIREYDISKANINILLYKGLIDKQTYDRFYVMPKKERAIKIGLMLRDNQELNMALTAGFAEMRNLFFIENDVQDYEVLAVKKDAIFLIGKQAPHTRFGNVEFKCKNVYTSFYRLAGVEYYYYLDTINQVEKLDVKGISDNVLAYHEPYMLDFLRYIFFSIQTGQIQDVIKDIQQFSADMTSGKLDMGYYRELNNRSLFRSRAVIAGNRIYYRYPVRSVKPIDIDCSFNYMILQELFKIALQFYLH